MDGLFHENHEKASKVLVDVLGLRWDNIARSHQDYFGNLPNGHRHLAVEHYLRKYANSANTHDMLAVGLHRDKEYTNAAGNLDAGNEEIAGASHVLAYNLGKDHPLAKQMAEYHDYRYEATSKYRQLLGMDKEDTDRKFYDQMRDSRHDDDPWRNFGGN